MAQAPARWAGAGGPALAREVVWKFFAQGVEAADTHGSACKTNFVRMTNALAATQARAAQMRRLS
jgi:hypothetical protein